MEEFNKPKEEPRGRTRVRRLSAREMETRDNPRARSLRSANLDEDEKAGSQETRVRELREARNVARSRPNQSSIMDEDPEEGAGEGTEMEDMNPAEEEAGMEGGEGEGTEMETQRSNVRRPSAREMNRDNPRGRSLRSVNFDEPVEDDGAGVFEGGANNAEPPNTERQAGEGEMEEQEAPAETADDDMRPVSLDDSSPPESQSQFQRSFKNKMRRLLRKPPTTDAPSAENELTEARSAESTAQEASTEADDTLDSIDDAVDESKSLLSKAKAGLDKAKAQVSTTEEADNPNVEEPDFDEGDLDADAEAGVAGEEAEGLEDAGDEVEDLDEVGEDAGDAGDAGDAAGDVADVADAAEGTGEAVGLEEAAGAAEAGGGGPEDPVGDIVAGVLAIAGGFVALGQWFSGLFHHNPTWQGIQNASALSGSTYTSMINNIDTEIAKTTNTPAQTAALNRYKATLQQANTDGRSIISYHNAKGAKAIAIQLSKKELANAIQAYQNNPDVYKGWSKNKLSIMGLNPEMSLGLAGATKDNHGDYVPKNFYDGGQKKIVPWGAGAGGGNYTNSWLSKAYQMTQEGGGHGGVGGGLNTFSTLADIKTSGNTPAQNKQIADGVYINQLQTQIELFKIGTFFTGYNNGTWNYLNYKMELFKFNNGIISTKPQPVPPPITKAGKAELAKLSAIEAQYNTSITSANTALQADAGKIATATATDAAGRRRLTTAQNALTTAQTAEAAAMAQSKSYDTNLANNLTTEYSQEYRGELENAIANNTSFNAGDLINPNKIYTQNAIAGTGVVAPKLMTPATGIQFVNGVPQVLAQPTRGGPGVLVNNAGPGVGGATTGVVNNRRGPLTQPTRPISSVSTAGGVVHKKPASILQRKPANIVMPPLLPARNQQNQVIPKAPAPHHFAK